MSHSLQQQQQQIRLTKTQPIYDNCAVLSIEGELLFRCAKKRANWYLSRGLACQVESKCLQNDSESEAAKEEIPLVIQLNFITRGRGRAGDAYYLEDRHDQCVCCGSDQGLTMHHVVPELYRQHMPLSVKSRSSHDILPLCSKCHDQYEKSAMDLKKKIAQQYSLPLEGQGWIECREDGVVRRAASALLLHKSKIPEARQDSLAKCVKEWWQNHIADTNEALIDQDSTDTIHNIPRQILKQACLLKDRVKGLDFIEHGEYIVQQLLQQQDTNENGQLCWPDLEAFIRQWRKHFIDHTHPAYLSPHWHVDDPIYTYI
ncbi:hypothetical protein BDF19DRAFT_297357 [Syncephalis fuscata]|nr:hypothetical protein BDF19DRAFT_297357 [Syncephalis fuscata]